MRVLVTGACGFIGSHVCEALLARGDTVVGIDNFNSFYDPQVKEAHRALLERNERFSLMRGSILDPVALSAATTTAPEGIVHLAAWAGVRPSIEQPALYARENVDGTVAVLEAARQLGTRPKVVLASSSSVYGGNSKVPFHEDDPVNAPVSPYAATKRACELLSFTYHHLHGLDVSCLRYFTVYGPRQRPEMAIHKFAELLCAGKSVPCYGDGKSARDYTYVDDIVQGTLSALDRCGSVAGHRIYNLGNARTVTLDALVVALARALGVEARVEHLPPQPGDVPLTFASIERAAHELDYRPDFPLERGLATFAAWFHDQRALRARA